MRGLLHPVGQIGAVLIAGCLLVSSAIAQGVRDHAFLFKKPGSDQHATKSIERANKQIKSIAQYPPHKSILIETIDTVHDLPIAWQQDMQNRVNEFDLEDDAQVDKLFEAIGQYRIDQTELEGVYILISLDPEYVLVMPSVDTTSLFTGNDARQVQSVLVNALKLKKAPSKQNRLRRWASKVIRKRDPVRGLREAIDLTGRLLVYNMPVDNTGWSWAIGSILGTLGLWSFLGMVKTRVRRRSGPESIGVDPRIVDELPVSPMGGAVGTIAGDGLIAKLFRRKKPSPEVVPPDEDLPTEMPEQQEISVPS